MHRDRQLATLRYWMDVEGLTAPDAGKEERERYQDCVHVIDERLPWFEPKPQGPLRIHYVRFGIMHRRDYEDALRATLDARADAIVDGGRKQVFGPLTYLLPRRVCRRGRRTQLRVRTPGAPRRLRQLLCGAAGR